MWSLCRSGRQLKGSARAGPCASFQPLNMSAAQDGEAGALPCVLITSCDGQFEEEELIKQILGVATLPEPSKQQGVVRWYPWTINNKYYTADVGLCVVPSPFEVTAEVARSLQAFIVYFDSAESRGLDSVGPWLAVVEELAPEVLILVCDRVHDNGVSRQQAQQWCLAHAFELVELNPEDLPDEDDDFPESTGVKRIVQALNANVWSSVEMKDEHNQGFGLMSSLVASRHNNPRPKQDSNSPPLPVEGGDDGREEENTEMAANGDTGVNALDPMTDIDIQELASLTNGDADAENFERLFTKLKEMKDKASSLPHEERKVHAEKVAKAFWMAIGGDQDEIEGLSSGEES
ncbi:alpha- and gamma-adaptin-binding protein p34 isoform X2 [Scleropages formosus]|uniref:Alpha and gamma adaptin binding protein n=1 Tax=Scleropages formosus TaxID=113540 RepID=A0A8C9RGM6_SCLFO|nr:alpha- and gamma-adaptin-binding protein p34 isoform X2 [Scleropages formosus]